jgi:hypothetical protein
MGSNRIRGLVAAAVVTLGPLPAIADDAAVARELVERAARSVEAHRPGLALLQLTHAKRLAPRVRVPDPLRRRLDALMRREAELMERGLAAARARDSPAVQHVVHQLLDIDADSSCALELMLRANAALADHGGAVQRHHWYPDPTAPGR